MFWCPTFCHRPTLMISNCTPALDTDEARKAETVPSDAPRFFTICRYIAHLNSIANIIGMHVSCLRYDQYFPPSLVYMG